MLAREHGAIMLETLVALLVFSFGLVGILWLQGAALGWQRQALAQARAAHLASELGERLRLNLAGVAAGAYQTGPNDAAAGLPAFTCAAPRSPAQLARCDLQAMASATRAALPDGHLSIGAAAGDGVPVRFSWSEPRRGMAGDLDAGDCAPAASPAIAPLAAVGRRCLQFVLRGS